MSANTASKAAEAGSIDPEPECRKDDALANSNTSKLPEGVQPTLAATTAPISGPDALANARAAVARLKAEIAAVEEEAEDLRFEIDFSKKMRGE